MSGSWCPDLGLALCSVALSRSVVPNECALAGLTIPPAPLERLWRTPKPKLKLHMKSALAFPHMLESMTAEPRCKPFRATPTSPRYTSVRVLACSAVSCCNLYCSASGQPSATRHARARARTTTKPVKWTRVVPVAATKALDLLPHALEERQRCPSGLQLLWLRCYWGCGWR